MHLGEAGSPEAVRAGTLNLQLDECFSQNFIG
jgi:hypothetical protein